MSEWLDLMLEEIDRRRDEDEEDLQEAKRCTDEAHGKDAVAQEN